MSRGLFAMGPLHQARIPEHPAPLLATGNVWRWGDIVRWLWDTKRIDMDENLPTAADVDHIDACLKRVPDITTQAWDEVQVIEPRYKETIRSARRPTKQPLVEFVWPDGGDRVIVVAAGGRPVAPVTRGADPCRLNGSSRLGLVIGCCPNRDSMRLVGVTAKRMTSCRRDYLLNPHDPEPLPR